jgi:hypothetical protein
MSVQKWRRNLEGWRAKLQSRCDRRRQKRNEKRMQKWSEREKERKSLLRQADSDVSKEVRPDFDLEVFRAVVEHFRHNLEIFGSTTSSSS